MHTILVVARMSSLRDSFSFLLSDEETTVLTAGTAAEALDVWNEHRAEISVVLTDCKLEKAGDGAELILTMRNEKRDTLFILMSGNEHNERFAREIGVHFHLKAVNNDPLLDLIYQTFANES